MPDDVGNDGSARVERQQLSGGWPKQRIDARHGSTRLLAHHDSTLAS
ncbi:hypothetical protein [Nocardioides litoris]|nr:hypothetical protein [Nocardioides litoris]